MGDVIKRSATERKRYANAPHCGADKEKEMPNNEALKGIFGSEALTFEQFAAKTQGSDYVDISKGGFINKGDHDKALEEARRTTVTASKEFTDLTAERDDYKTKYETLVAENAKKERVAKVSDKVAPEFVEFIADKVAREMAALPEGDKTTFEQKLDEVLKTSPQYKKVGARRVVSSSFKQEQEERGRNGGGSTVNSAMNNALLAAFGRSPKA